jgi:hypothetical protein
MGFLKFAPHMERVMKHVGDRQSVKITNYTDSGQEDDRGETIWDDESFVVDEAIVELEQSAFNRETQGAENLYDAQIFVPLNTDVFEADQTHQSSEVSVDNKNYIVEKTDKQNGMIVLGCRRKR